jgi:hypothetical protein
MMEDDLPQASITSTLYSNPDDNEGRSFTLIVVDPEFTLPTALFSGSYTVTIYGAIPEDIVAVMFVAPMEHEAAAAAVTSRGTRVAENGNRNGIS